MFIEFNFDGLSDECSPILQYKHSCCNCGYTYYSTACYVYIRCPRCGCPFGGNGESVDFEYDDECCGPSRRKFRLVCRSRCKPPHRLCHKRHIRCRLRCRGKKGYCLR